MSDHSFNELMDVDVSISNLNSELDINFDLSRYVYDELTALNAELDDLVISYKKLEGRYNSISKWMTNNNSDSSSESVSYHAVITSKIAKVA